MNASAYFPLLQPDNIYEFGAQYFAELLAQQQANAAHASSSSSSSSSGGSRSNSDVVQNC